MTDKRGCASLAEAVKRAYDKGQTDYYLEPLSLEDASGAAVGTINPGDAVIFCCRRGEREIELTDAFTDRDFKGFERAPIEPLDFIIMTMYHEKYKSMPIAFAPSKLSAPLAQVLSRAGRTQLHCAESEKFAHVTYFFNGGHNDAFPGEDDVRIPSPKGIPFDQKPELSLPEVASAVISGIEKGYDFIVTNFANGDVIGHTSSTEAKLACASHVDAALGRVLDSAHEHGYVVAITADHGNLETLYTPSGKPHVAHTGVKVPFIMIDPAAPAPIPLKNGALCDVAPTVLDVMGIDAPAEFSGESLATDHDFGSGRKCLLIILDGWGVGSRDENDAIFLADTPVWDALCTVYPPSLLDASGEYVGLVSGKAGNSEAGHSNLGAGRTVAQDDVRLDDSLKSGAFAQNPVFLEAIDSVKARKGALHLLSYLTKKSSHGSIDYPISLTRMAKERGLTDVFLHIIFDGRSTEPGSAPALLEELGETLDAIGAGLVTGGIGRGFALDRDMNFEKVKKAYDCFVSGAGERYRAL